MRVLELSATRVMTTYAVTVYREDGRRPRYFRIVRFADGSYFCAACAAASCGHTRAVKRALKRKRARGDQA